jgi:hypothetical protein
MRRRMLSRSRAGDLREGARPRASQYGAEPQQPRPPASVFDVFFVGHDPPIVPVGWFGALSAGPQPLIRQEVVTGCRTKGWRTQACEPEQGWAPCCGCGTRRTASYSWTSPSFARGNEDERLRGSPGPARGLLRARVGPRSPIAR